MASGFSMAHLVATRDVTTTVQPIEFNAAIFTSGSTEGQGVSSATPRRRKRICLRKSNKSVRFSDDHVIVHEIPRCDDEPDLIWFSSEELALFRSKGRGLAMQICAMDRVEGKSTSYKNVIEATYYQSSVSASVSASETIPDKALLVWIQHGHSRRGLERWSVPSLADERNQARNALLQRIKILQRTAMPEKDLALRKLSEYYSAQGTRFAAAMGIADALAADAELRRN